MLDNADLLNRVLRDTPDAPPCRVCEGAGRVPTAGGRGEEVCPRCEGTGDEPDDPNAFDRDEEEES